MTIVHLHTIEDQACAGMRSLRAFGHHIDGTWPMPTGGHNLEWHKGYVAALHAIIHEATGVPYQTIALRLNKRIQDGTE
jgi:hypothetical protein